MELPVVDNYTTYKPSGVVYWPWELPKDTPPPDPPNKYWRQRPTTWGELGGTFKKLNLNSAQVNCTLTVS